jgi:predicted phage baseplate assembly protein
VLEPAAVAATSEGEASPEETLHNTIEGNVLALRFTGPRAVTTGIAPDNPPLDWQVWTGERWQSGILRQRSDDHTRGFSFDRLGFAGPNPEQEGADVVLHLPQTWPVHRFGNYQGHWIRCVYTEPDSTTRQTGYDRSPEITGLSLRALGGTITASECVHMPEEFLGTSDGKAGQEFQLEGTPVLDRDPEERIFVMLPDGEVQDDWQEVEHFGDSREDDPHYTIDSTTGRVQFGPLIREPSQLVMQTRDRSQLQSWGRPFRQRRSLTLTETQTSLPAVMDTDSRELERQYGRVLPLGAKVYIRRYRVGGGSRGNVQAEQLKVLKTAIPYVKRVINYQPATGGTDAESLDQAVMRVPSLLRTRKTTLSPEEFEQAARQFTGDHDDIRLIYRAHSVTAPHLATPGVVHLLVIPYPENWAHLSLEGGIHPQTLLLTPELTTSLQQHLDAHRALGIRVKPDSPDYVGIQVSAQVVLSVPPRTTVETAAIRQKLCTHLYRYFNPFTGGPNGKGWPLGRAARSVDVIAQLQAMEEVQYVGAVSLYSYRRNGYAEDAPWVPVSGPEATIPLGPLEVACSWQNPLQANETAPAHELVFLEP